MAGSGIRKPQVAGSIPVAGSILSIGCEGSGQYPICRLRVRARSVSQDLSMESQGLGNIQTAGQSFGHDCSINSSLDIEANLQRCIGRMKPLKLLPEALLLSSFIYYGCSYQVFPSDILTGVDHNFDFARWRMAQALNRLRRADCPRLDSGRRRTRRWKC